MDVTRNPEIQRLLANLRRSNAENEASTAPLFDSGVNPGQTGGYDFASATVDNLPGLGLLPYQENTRTSISSNHSRSPAPQQQPTPTVPHREIRQEKSPTPAIPDASSIVTWPAALKHITRHIGSNEKAASKIKHLIAEQHKHERQWWAGREAITARHTDRAGNQQKAAELLRSLGGLAVPVAASDPAAQKAELEAYDKKVHRGMTEMAADFDRQLRNLGVPFYCIRHDLVILEEGKQKDEDGKKNRIDRGELRELQKRMLQTLEDLFADD